MSMEDWKKRRDELAEVFWDDFNKTARTAHAKTIFTDGYDAGRADAMAEYDLLMAEAEMLADALESNNQMIMWDLRNKALESWNQFKTKKD